jgi:hypothetical protein
MPLPQTAIPDVCDIVEYRSKKYRVTSWLRERPAPAKALGGSDEDLSDLGGLLDDILYESQQKVHGRRLEHCYREEAEFLSLTGVGGTIAPVEDCKVIGRVNWTQDSTNNALESANRMAKKRQPVF